MDWETAMLAAEAFEASVPTLVDVHAERHPVNDDHVWVYVMAEDQKDSDLIKVGISKHPEYRRLTLEKERRLNLHIAHTEGPYTRPQALSIERIAHNMLSSHREHGEWFLCGAERAIDVVRTCAFADGL